jgi:tRNA (guanosine-2'-O-)-methyltransferase
MFGFTESFNVSVSAAIVLYELRLKLSESSINWKLDEKEAMELKLKWLRKSIKKANLIEKDFKAKYYS